MLKSQVTFILSNLHLANVKNAHVRPVTLSLFPGRDDISSRDALHCFISTLTGTSKTDRTGMMASHYKNCAREIARLTPCCLSLPEFLALSPPDHMAIRIYGLIRRCHVVSNHHAEYYAKTDPNNRCSSVIPPSESCIDDDLNTTSPPSDPSVDDDLDCLFARKEVFEDGRVLTLINRLNALAGLPKLHHVPAESIEVLLCAFAFGELPSPFGINLFQNKPYREMNPTLYDFNDFGNNESPVQQRAPVQQRSRLHKRKSSI